MNQNNPQHEIFLEEQDYSMKTKSTDQLMEMIGSMSGMIFTAVGILAVILFILFKKRFSHSYKTEEQQESQLKQQQLASRSMKSMRRQEHVSNQLNKKSYSFNEMNQQMNRYQSRQQLINILHDRALQSSLQPYSFYQKKINFLNKLNREKYDQNGVYYDQEDIKEREMRKLQVQKEKNQLMQKEFQKTVMKSSEKVKAKEKQKEEEKKNLLQENVIQAPIQPPAKPIGEKTIFADKPKSQTTPPVKKELNFGNISLGLPSEKTVTQKKTQQNIGLFGNLSKPSEAKEEKKEEKPSLFPNTNFGSLFGQQSSTQIGGDKKPSLFGATTITTQPQTNLFGQKQAQIQKQQTDKKEQISAPKPQSQQQPVLPQPSSQQSITQRPPVFASSSSPAVFIPQKIQKKDYLQMLIDYSKGAKQHGELKKTKINNFSRSISNLKQIYDTANDFIHTINIGDPKQVETLACVIYDFLANTTIPAWPKQEGWQMFPPRAKNETKWKISITTYVIKLNLYRAMGYETLWLIVFGKLLSLLDFTWKRTTIIPQSAHAYKQLDLVKNGYFSLHNQQDMAPKYFTRLDLITYFLFCMTTFDPQLIAEYLCQTAGQDKKTLEQIKKLKYKWSYNYFWILVETILNNKTKTYFKPILYMNILAAMYLQIRKNKLNSGDFADFDHLRKFLVKEGIQYTTGSQLQRNQEIQTFAEIDQQNRDFTFDGEDFLGQIETLNFYFIEKNDEYRKASADRKGFEEFEKRCSVFDFFKSQSRLG